MRSVGIDYDIQGHDADSTDAIIKKKIMPYNQNGKIDRKWLKNHYED